MMVARDDGPQFKAELDKAVAMLVDANAELVDLRSRAVAVAEEYEREPRMISSGAVADMLREWAGVPR